MVKALLGFRVSLLAMACVLVACQAKAPTLSRPTNRGPGSGLAVLGEPSPSPRAALPGSEAVRALPSGLPRQLVAGEVRLLSDQGGGLLSNHGGGIISNNSGAILSNNAGSLVANNGGGLRAWRGALAQAEGGASQVASFRLAEAQVELLDAQGQRLAGPDGQPLVATTDAQGRYRLEAALPQEALLLRVRLFRGGELVGLLPKGRAASLEAFDLDPERSLATRYVQERIAPTRPKLLDTVDAGALERVRQALKAAGLAKALGAKPSYSLEAQVQVAQALRLVDACVDEAFAAIERLVGQEALGNGRQALEVPLALLAGLAVGPKGQLYVYEATGRLREVGVDGSVRVVAGLGSTGPDLGYTHDLDALPDGALLFCEAWEDRVVKLVPPAEAGGLWRREILLGPGANGPFTLPRPQAVAVLPDGQLVVAERAASSGNPIPLWRVDLAGGKQSPLPPLPAPYGQRTPMVRDLMVEPGGAVVVAVEPRFGATHENGDYWRLSPGAEGGTWTQLVGQTRAARSFLVGEGGELWWPDDHQHVVWHRLPDGRLEVAAGQKGQPGFAGDGGPAKEARFQQVGELVSGPQGAWYLTDEANGVVRRVSATGEVSTEVGRLASRAVGDLNGLAVNTPFGLARSEDGQSMLVSEFSSHTLKRIVGGKAELFAGGQRGLSEEGGDRADANMNGPAGVASDRKGGFLLADSANRRVRRVDAQGRVTTVAGPTAQKADGSSYRMGNILSVAASLDGQKVYWTDGDTGTVGVVGPDGVGRVFAGTPSFSQGIEGEDALATRLESPLGLAVGPDGTVYVSELLGMRVRAISPQGKIRTLAGLPGGLAPALVASAEAPAADAAASTVPLLLPGPLVVAPDGALLVAEFGTAKLDAIRKIGLPYVFGGLPAGMPQHAARVSRIDPVTGRFQVLAGRGTQVLASEESELFLPLGMAFAPDGRLAIADALANQIWALRYGAGASCSVP